jgi:flagellar protein FlaG
MAIQPVTSAPVTTATASPAGSPRAPRADVEVEFSDAPSPATDRAQLHAALEAINRHMRESSQNLLFTMDEETGEVIVRVVDTETEQVILQIPSEEALAISRSIEKLQGMLLHQKA